MGDSTPATPAPTPAPTDPPTDPRLDWPRIVVIALLVALGVFLFRPVLVPVSLAVLIAYLLAPPVELLERLGVGRWRVPRWLAVLFVYSFVLAALSGAAAFFVPRLWVDARELTTRLPAMGETVRDEWIPALEAALGLQPVEPAPTEPDRALTPSAPILRIVPEAEGGFAVHLPPEGFVVDDDGHGRLHVRPNAPAIARRTGLGDILTNLLSRGADFVDRESLRLLAGVRDLLTATAGGLFTAFFVFVGSGYLLATVHHATAFAASLVPPERRPGLRTLVERIDRGLAGVVRGQVLIALVNGVLSGVGFVLLGLDHWVMLTGITTVASLVPVFGSLLTSVPAVMIGLDQGLGTAVLVVVWLLAIHQLEASVLNPRIMGDAARLSAVLVLFALLAGERWLGAPGLLLAVPTLSVLSSVLFHVRDRAYGEDAHPMRLSRVPSVPPPTP